MNLRRLLSGIWRRVLCFCARIPTGNHECVICKKSFLRFLPYRDGSQGVPTLMKVLEGVGSDVDNFSCPWCFSHDRERHLFLYMKEAGLFSFVKAKRVLHFAPEPHISRLVEETEPELLIKCDLYPWARDMVKVDLLSLPYSDGYFDLLIANHVLEHVEDDRRALSEIVRVLKPGGYAILQTPYSAALEHTWEDSGISSREARLEAYGQEDHVRLFGRDIFERFAHQGLESKVKLHEELLKNYSPRRFGLNSREPFFLFRKPE